MSDAGRRDPESNGDTVREESRGRGGTSRTNEDAGAPRGGPGGEDGAARGASETGEPAEAPGDGSDDHSAVTEAGLSPKPGLGLKIEKKLGLLADLEVVTFPAHGQRRWLQVKGRLVEGRGLARTSDDAGLASNIMNTVRRLKSDEIPGGRVKASYRGGHWETVTDDEGYFTFRIEPEGLLEPGWHEVPLTVESPFDGKVLEAKAPVLVPFPDAEFAVVSDLDDTVIRTGATDFFEELRMVFGRNARSRPPFPGVAALYRALQAGPDGRGHNPLFYVSLSGWNLYDLFAEFMDHHDIPAGPFFMQDLSIIEDPSEHIAQADPKLEGVGILLENYPDLPFILIGDSGQQDPEHYREIVDRHPNRILAIYIRDVTPDKRDRVVRAIAKEVAAKGVPMILAADSTAVAEHAAELGFIRPQAVDEIRAEVEREQREDEDGG